MLTPHPCNSGRLWCKVQNDSHEQALVCGRGDRNPLTLSEGQSRGHWAAGGQMEECSQPPAEELRLEHGDEHEHRRWGQSSRPCRTQV